MLRVKILNTTGVLLVIPVYFGGASASAESFTHDLRGCNVAEEERQLAVKPII